MHYVDKPKPITPEGSLLEAKLGSRLKDPMASEWQSTLEQSEVAHPTALEANHENCN